MTKNQKLQNANPALKTVKVRSMIPSPFSRWWRNPIAWWKLRHLRADLKVVDELVDDRLVESIDRAEEDAFINGVRQG